MKQHSELRKMVMAAHKAGLQVIPCKPGTKEAAVKWKKYHDEYQYRNTDSDVKMWVDAGYSTFLVLTGLTSGNLEVLDFDVLSNGTNVFDEFMSTAVASIVKDCPVVTSGKGGKHLWYYSEEPSTKGLKLAYQQDGEKEQVVIETRANKQYIVLPFSLHPNGTYYLIDGDAEDFINSIPTIEANDLEMIHAVARTFNTIEPKVIDRVPRVEGGNKQYPNDSTINRFNKETSIEDTLEKYGYTFASQVNEKEMNYYRPGKTEGSSSVSVHLDTNTSWHYSENDEMSGRNKQITPFDIFCHFEHGGDTRKAVYTLSQIYNKEKYEMNEFMLDANGNPTGFKKAAVRVNHYNGIETQVLPTAVKEEVTVENTEDDEEIKIDTNRYLPDGSVIKSGRFAAMTLGELEALPPLEWLVKGWFTKECIGILRGEPGVGKTFVVFDSLFSMACGKPVAGKFETKRPLRCLYIATEGKGGLSRRATACKSKFTKDEIDLINKNFLYIPEMPSLLTPSDISELVYSYDEAKIDVVVFDTLSTSIIGGDENSQAVMSLAIANARLVGKKLGAAVIIIHHNNKQGDVRGSTVILGNVDFMMNLKAEAQNQVSITSDKVKDGSKWKDVNYSLEVVPFNDGESSCRVKWLTEGEVKTKAEATTKKEKIIQYFKVNGCQWLTTEMIEKNLGQASGSLSSEISRIVTDTTLGLTFKVEPAKDVIDNKLHGKIMAYQLISW